MYKEQQETCGKIQHPERFLPELKKRLRETKALRAEHHELFCSQVVAREIEGAPGALVEEQRQILRGLRAKEKDIQAAIDIFAVVDRQLASYNSVKIRRHERRIVDEQKTEADGR